MRSKHATIAILTVVSLGTGVLNGQSSAANSRLIDTALSGMTSPDSLIRMQSFRALTRIPDFPFDPADFEDTHILGLLRSSPGQADRIKITLIAVLERDAGFWRAQNAANITTTEEYYNYFIKLSSAVGLQRDKRAIGALAAAAAFEAHAGDYLADLCPDAIDAIIAEFRKPEVYFEGRSTFTRGLTIRALGSCLARPGWTRVNQHAWDKARGLLLEAMDDPDPGVRGVSIETLALMASDPLVRDRLKRASVEEPAVVPIPGHPELPGRYYHREAALRALGPPNDPQMANVTRNSVTRECRVQAVSEVPVGEVYIGPVRQAPQAMCGHLDTTRKDPSLCWLTVPADACARRAN